MHTSFLTCHAVVLWTVQRQQYNYNYTKLQFCIHKLKTSNKICIFVQKMKMLWAILKSLAPSREPALVECNFSFACSLRFQYRSYRQYVCLIWNIFWRLYCCSTCRLCGWINLNFNNHFDDFYSYGSRKIRLHNIKCQKQRYSVVEHLSDFDKRITHVPLLKKKWLSRPTTDNRLFWRESLFFIWVDFFGMVWKREPFKMVM